MKAVKVYRPEDYRLEEADVPQIESGEVLVKVPRRRSICSPCR
jgi:hypothetical protein